MRILACCVPLLIALTGCGPLGGDGPRLVVDPKIVRLPGVRDGEIGRASLRLLNLGETALKLNGLRLLTDGRGWALTAPPLPALVPPAQELGVAVTYRPGPGVEPTCTLWVETDDLTEPERGVTVQALPGFVLVAATPGSVEFGAVASGGSATRLVRLQNLGLTAALDLRFEWEEPSDDFTATLPANLISAGAALDLALRYTPRGGDADRALLRLRWSTGTRLVPMSGWQDLRAPD